jgi:hypothetical protein
MPARLDRSARTLRWSPQHLPHRRYVTEGKVAGAIRLARSGLRQPGGDLLRRAQVALGDNAGLAVHPSGLGQVVISLPTLLLANDESHI